MTAAPASWSSGWLAVRSLLWTLLLPVFFAGYVPWRFFGLSRMRLDWSSPASLLGVVCIGIGAVLLAACIVEFARSGRGTLSPVDPPRHLVVRGLYRYVRNPMYLSVTTIVLGEVLLTRSGALPAKAALLPPRGAVDETCYRAHISQEVWAHARYSISASRLKHRRADEAEHR